MKKNKFLLGVLTTLALMITSCKMPGLEQYFKISYEQSEKVTVDLPKGFMVREETAITEEMVPTYSIEGFTFEGWAFKANKVYVGDLVKGDMTLKPLFTSHTYKLTIVWNGISAEGIFNRTSFTADEEIILPTAAALSKEGCKFVGWYTDEALTTPITKIAKGTTKDITIYAKWDAKFNTITYHLGEGGTFVSTDRSLTKVSDGVYTEKYAPANGYKLPTFEEIYKPAYQLEAWFSDEAKTTQYYNGSQPEDGAHAYARYDPIYEFTFDLNGGSFKANSENFKKYCTWVEENKVFSTRYRISPVTAVNNLFIDDIENGNFELLGWAKVGESSEILYSKITDVGRLGTVINLKAIWGRTGISVTCKNLGDATFTIDLPTTVNSDTLYESLPKFYESNLIDGKLVAYWKMDGKRVTSKTIIDTSKTSVEVEPVFEKPLTVTYYTPEAWYSKSKTFEDSTGNTWDTLAAPSSELPESIKKSIPPSAIYSYLTEDTDLDYWTKYRVPGTIGGIGQNGFYKWGYNDKIISENTEFPQDGSAITISAYYYYYSVKIELSNAKVKYAGKTYSESSRNHYFSSNFYEYNQKASFEPVDDGSGKEMEVIVNTIPDLKTLSEDDLCKYKTVTKLYKDGPMDLTVNEIDIKVKYRKHGKIQINAGAAEYYYPEEIKLYPLPDGQTWKLRFPGDSSWQDISVLGFEFDSTENKWLIKDTTKINNQFQKIDENGFEFSISNSSLLK